MPLDAQENDNVNLWTVLKRKDVQSKRGENAFTVLLWFLEASLHKLNLSKHSIIANILERIDWKGENFQESFEYWIRQLRSKNFLQKHHLKYQSTENPEILSASESSRVRVRDLHLFDNENNWGLIFEFKMTSELPFTQLKEYLERINRYHSRKNLCGFIVTLKEDLPTLIEIDNRYPFAITNYYLIKETITDVLNNLDQDNSKIQIIYQFLADSLEQVLIIPSYVIDLFKKIGIKFGRRFLITYYSVGEQGIKRLVSEGKMKQKEANPSIYNKDLEWLIENRILRKINGDIEVPNSTKKAILKYWEFDSYNRRIARERGT